MLNWLRSESGFQNQTNFMHSFEVFSLIKSLPPVISHRPIGRVLARDGTAIFREQLQIKSLEWIDIFSLGV